MCHFFQCLGDCHVGHKGSCHAAQGDIYSFTFKQNTFFYGKLVSGTPEVTCNSWDISHSVRPAIEGQSVNWSMYRIFLHGISNMIYAIRIKVDAFYILMKLYWCVIFVRRES